MFTGIVQAIGFIDAVEARAEDMQVHVATNELDLDDAATGESIAVNGVCLTAVALREDGFSADVSHETLARTTLKHLRKGSRVNLERALAVGDKIGGHLVSGHVDGVAVVRARRDAVRSVELRVAVPHALAKYIAEKGSVCLDGVSLTVNRVDGAEFDVNLVPHTRHATTLNDLMPGSEVNLEVDLLARYLERLLLGAEAAGTDDVAAEFLARAGLKNI